MKVIAEDAKGLFMNCLRCSCGVKCEHCEGIHITVNDGIIRIYPVLRNT
jgi:hypothetical protein